MTTRQVIEAGSAHLASLAGHTFGILTFSRPSSVDAAVSLSRIISKLSPLLGNLIEFNAVDFLNSKREFTGRGVWRRQDPDFPDIVFDGPVKPRPGFEIKAWFPLATEITARFRDSQNQFRQDNIYVGMLAWLLDHLIFGKPRIIDVCIVSGRSAAEARDNHYHNPPDYLVVEPEETSTRTRNLQQTNTNGLKFQGTAEDLAKATRIVESWGPNGRQYSPTREYQRRVQELRSQFSYRLDTNYAKMDRIMHAGIEEFKTRVENTSANGLPVTEWKRLLDFEDRNPKKQAKKEAALRKALADQLGIR